MSRLLFDTFFKAATGHQGPFDYQRRLACGERGNREDNEWLTDGTGCRSQLINIPTGLGKTAAVVIAWLWNRVRQPDPKWPRRLVYCLPMRTLVEQTEREIATWLTNLRNHAEAFGLGVDVKQELEWLVEHSPIILMGGEEPDRAWDVWPERPAILVGTQDMLLSRALNRGYGMSRYRWPMHFAWLNNDAHWVMDETQLMGVGVETSAQLDGFRHDPEMPTLGLCPTWWMSATLESTRLATVDHPQPPDGWPLVRLGQDDLSRDDVRTRMRAGKALARGDIPLSALTKGTYAKHLAEWISRQHQPHSLTLISLARAADMRASAGESGLPGPGLSSRDMALREDAGADTVAPARFSDERPLASKSELHAKRPQLEQLCRRTNVLNLDLFVSAALGTFDPETSDLDFVVTFGEFPQGGLFDAYMDLAEGLEAIFGRPVDLVTDRSIRNPYFRRSVESSRKRIFHI